MKPVKSSFPDIAQGQVCHFVKSLLYFLTGGNEEILTAPSKGRKRQHIKTGLPALQLSSQPV